MDKYRPHRENSGLIWRAGPICEVLSESCGISISPSGYYAFRSRGLSARGISDERLKERIAAIHRENYSCYGVRKVWRALLNEDIKAARRTVGRLMKILGLRGAVRGKAERTAISGVTPHRAAGLVSRDFDAPSPDKLWVADFTCIYTRTGWCYAAFITDVFARMIAGYRVSTRMDRNMAPPAFRTALHARARRGRGAVAGLIHHSDKGSQYTADGFAGLLASRGVRASIGSAGDSHGNALAETVNGAYKTELINMFGPWEGYEMLNLRTAEWVHWHNNSRISERNNYKTPAQTEELWYSTGMDSRKLSKTRP